VQALPKVIKSLSVRYTSYTVVAGGIFVHEIIGFTWRITQLPSILTEFVIGLAFGGIVLGNCYAFKITGKSKQQFNTF
jgi:hypothetical protein